MFCPGHSPEASRSVSAVTPGQVEYDRRFWRADAAKEASSKGTEEAGRQERIC